LRAARLLLRRRPPAASDAPKTVAFARRIGFGQRDSKALSIEGVIMKTFRTYNLARDFYRLVVPLKLVRPLRDQLHRAAASVALNLAEGYGRQTLADQRRFFAMALGSVRECQAVLDLAADAVPAPLRDHLDHLAASTWRLLHPAG